MGQIDKTGGLHKGNTPVLYKISITKKSENLMKCIERQGDIWYTEVEKGQLFANLHFLTLDYPKNTFFENSFS